MRKPLLTDEAIRENAAKYGGAGSNIIVAAKRTAYEIGAIEAREVYESKLADLEAPIMGACAEGTCHACPRWFDLGGGCACRCHVFRDWQADAMQSHGVKAAWFAGWEAALYALRSALKGRNP
jgi:hypothetical protein